MTDETQTEIKETEQPVNQPQETESQPSEEFKLHREDNINPHGEILIQKQLGVNNTAPVEALDLGSSDKIGFGGTAGVSMDTNNLIAEKLLKLTSAAVDPTGGTGSLYFNTDDTRFSGYTGAAWKQLCWYDERNDGQDINQYAEFTYGEALTAGNAVFIGDNTRGVQVKMLDSGSADGDYSFGKSSTYQKVHQIVEGDDYTPSNIKYVTVRIKKSGSPADDITVSITNFDGDVTYGSGTIANASITSSYTNIECALSTTVANPGTDFAVQMERNGSLSDSDYFMVSYISGGVTGGSYAMGYWDGDSWENYAYDMKTLYLQSLWASGSAYKADADDATKTKFDGMAIDSGSKGDTGTVQINGIYTTTGLTAGAKYYLSDTGGAISLTRGTYEAKAGIALSTTQLYLSPTEHWEYLGTGTSTDVGDNTSGSIDGVPARCNFIICQVEDNAEASGTSGVYVEVVLGRKGKTTAITASNLGGTQDTLTLTFDTANNQIDYTTNDGDNSQSWTIVPYYYS